MKIPLRDLMDRHAGERVWIFGKGPSLDRVQWNLLPPAEARIYVNHAVKSDPTAGAEPIWGRYFIALDAGTFRDLGGVPAGCVGLVPTNLSPEFEKDPQGDPRQSGRPWVSFTNSSPYMEGRKGEVAEREILYTCCGTATPAAHLAWFMGAAEVAIAGCDGGADYAQCVKDRLGYDYDARHVGMPANYDRFRASMLRVLRVLRVPWIEPFGNPEGAAPPSAPAADSLRSCSAAR